MGKSFGTAKYEKGRWEIRCEPHVMVRLKRVFDKIDKSRHGCVMLSDTPENCRELLWFMQRYPMKVDPVNRLLVGDKLHRRREEMVQEVFAEGFKPRDFQLALPPRDYQARAAELFLRSGSQLLADDVGLGKTASFITALTDPRMRPALVVTLTHLPIQWRAEINRFLPGMTIYIPKQGTPPPRWPGMMGVPDVTILNYHKLSGWADTLAPHMHSVCFDEAQELRTGHATDVPAKYKAAQHLASFTQFRMGLSATPIYNYGGEIYSVLDVISPGCLGTFEEFTREWCSMAGDGKWRINDPKAFGTYVRDAGFMLRRTRADVGRELPPIQKIEHFVESDEGALNAVARDVADLARKILARSGDRTERMKNAGELNWRLRQATGIGKAPYVAEFVKLLVEAGESVLLYGWHREVYSIWQSQLADYNPLLFTGTESPLQKQSARDRFISGECKVLIMSLRAGAGLDGLQRRGRTVVFGELDWSPGVHEQCVGRIARDGQGHSVMAYYLVSDSGSDPVVSEALGIKKSQIEGIRNPTAELNEKILDGVLEGHIKKLATDFLRRFEGRRA